MNEAKKHNRSKGHSSFSLPRVIVESLIAQRASALEICAMMVIAQHTDASGVFSTASVKAVSTRCGANKKTVKKAIEKLRTRRVKFPVTVLTEDGKSIIKESSDPMLFNREDILREYPDTKIPDRARQILHAIPPCEETPWVRVWFGSNLVLGFGDFPRPLSVLRYLPDPATHLLLHIYAVTDMERWGGACPVGDHKAPSRLYNMKFIVDFDPNLSLYKASHTWSWGLSGVLPELTEYKRSLPHALDQLLDAGFVYEVITAFNDDVLQEDSSVFYQLHSVNKHGLPIDGEHGVARFIAQTAGNLDEPIWDKCGQFNHTYGVIVEKEHAVCVSGILRPRFRVTNPLNAGVSDGWNSIIERDREAFRMIQSWRVASGLDALPDAYPVTR